MRLFLNREPLKNAFLDMIKIFNDFSLRCKYIFAFVAILTLTCSSCGRRDDIDCAKQIGAKIPIGSAAESAEKELRKCGFKVTFDSAKRSYYADKVVRGGITDSRTQVSVQLDEQGKVSAVQVTPSVTAP